MLENVSQENLMLFLKLPIFGEAYKRLTNAKAKLKNPLNWFSLSIQPELCNSK